MAFVSQTYDPLAIKAGEVCTTRVVKFHEPYPKGVFNGLTFFQHLFNLPGAYFDVVTFSANISLLVMLPLRRVITCIGFHDSAKELRRYTNIHSKLYIVYHHNHKPLAAFVGSQNLVCPTTENIMIDVSQHKQFFVSYFQHMWEGAEKV